MSKTQNPQSHLFIKTDYLNIERHNSQKSNITDLNIENKKTNYITTTSEHNPNLQNIFKTKPPLLKIQNTQKNNNYIDINEYIGKESHRPLTLDIIDLKIKDFENGKTSNKNMGIIKGYAANTHEGLIRNYNEDRVSIIINMNKPKNYSIDLKGKWPKVSFFAIYDGHGGKNCAEYLRDNLHKFICNDINFPNNIEEAIRNGFKEAENDFINNYALSKINNNNINDRSGSCAVIVLIVENKVYIANVGDSRAIMSTNNGKKLREVTIDHKPNEIKEKNRIIKNGGKVYQSQTQLNNNNNNNNILIGPFRVFPGRLSVSRTIGDIEAKNIKFGGNPNVIIAIPEIYSFDLIHDDIDYFILGCDGIFDQMNNKEIFNSVWMIIHHFCKNNFNVHNICGKVVDYVLKASMARKSFDNVTCLIVSFKDFGDKNLFGKNLIVSSNERNHVKKYIRKNYSLENKSIRNILTDDLEEKKMNDEKNNKKIKSNDNLKDLSDLKENFYLKNNHTKNNNNNNEIENKEINKTSDNHLNGKPSFLNQDNFQQARYTQRESSNLFQLKQNQNLKNNKLPNNSINNNDNKTNETNNNYSNNNIISNNTEKYTPKIMNKRYNSSSKSRINNFYNNNFYDNKNYNKYHLITERNSNQNSIPKFNQKLISQTEPNNYNIFMTPKNSKSKKSNNNNGLGIKKKKDLFLETNDTYFIRNSLPQKYNTTSKENGFVSYTVGRNNTQNKNEKSDF